jgi:carbamoyl-phosphate synthase large subunit
MPKRTDIRKIMIIGSGPIVIGQACEFDYSGVQAVKALKKEGYEVVLLNSNPATIMTDPEFAHKTYLEPVTPDYAEAVIRKERPDALLPTLGGQTALNTARELARRGVLAECGVEVLGASIRSIELAEDRELFKEAMKKIGIGVPDSGTVTTLEEAEKVLDRIGLPLIVRPAFTLGGTGGSIIYNREEFAEKIKWGLDASPIQQVLLERSLIGWKEFELEVMRDHADNTVIVCSIENFDPMGVHTGDSITVAPAQTLTDKEYQTLRNMTIGVMSAVNISTGGSNVQFAVNPKDGEVLIIEMNPRVSRSSALASKATGFPIAKIAALLAVGYTLDELKNDITRKTVASFEPTIDYVVVKFPRWTFEKFAEADDELTTQMKSVGEAMAIGRTFKEALQKALRSLEIGRAGLGSDGKDAAIFTNAVKGWDADEVRGFIKGKLTRPNEQRVFFVKYALERGFSIEEIYRLSGIDPWFLDQIREIVSFESLLRDQTLDSLHRDMFREAKRFGFSDRQLGVILKSDEDKVREKRIGLGILPVYKLVDTSSAEFESYTPYYYSTYEDENEIRPSDKESVMILGSGPNRIGQGIEFDYCCVHCSFALKEAGYETVMVNCNPETVSTDYDTSDYLFFEPLTFEDVNHIWMNKRPKAAVIQFGGQTPLKLALSLKKAGIPIAGTSPDSIDLAEDRKLFAEFISRLGIRQPENGLAVSEETALTIARRIGYPVLLRPSYVLGGRSMEIVYDDDQLRRYITSAVEVSDNRPVLIDRFLDNALEVDVDAVCDGDEVFVAAVMEHIEEAGVHSGDSACVLPPRSIKPALVKQLEEFTVRIALELKVSGLINIQFALQDEVIYILEVNPRASRTVPFVSKATGIPLAKVAARVAMGAKLKEFDLRRKNEGFFSVKEVVMPFVKFPGVDPVLGPEMKSTGEVMGIDRDFGMAFGRSQIAAGSHLPSSGTVFASIRDKDKKASLEPIRKLAACGFGIMATSGTARFLEENGIAVKTVRKVSEGRPHVVDALKNGEIAFVINTPEGGPAKKDSFQIRRTTLSMGIPYVTTIAAASAVSEAIRSFSARKNAKPEVCALQDWYKG